jgi:hypothetical protein
MGGAAFLGGLMGGLAEGYGERKAEQRQEKKILSDEERQQALDDHNTSITNIQQKMSTLNPNTPEWGALRDQLAQVHADRTALFHPDQGPGAMAHLGRMVWEHVHGKPQPTQLAATPAATLPSAAGITIAPIAGAPATTLPPMPGSVQLPATPGVTVNPRATPAQLKAQTAETRAVQDLAAGAPAAPVNPYSEMRQQLKDAFPNLPDADVEKAVMIAAGAEAKPVAEKPETWTPMGKQPVQVGGTFMMPERNRAGEFRLQPLGYTPPAAIAPHLSNPAVQRTEWARALGKEPSELTPEEEGDMIAYFKARATGTTVGIRQSLQYDADGKPHIVDLTSTSTKRFGAAPSPSGTVSPEISPTEETEIPAPIAPARPGGVTTGTFQGQPVSIDAAGNAVNSITGASVGNIHQLPGRVTPIPTQPVPRTAGEAKQRVASQLDFRKATPAAAVAKKARDTAQAAYLDVQKASQDPTPVGDQGIVLAWLRGRVNRVTATEIQAVNNLGGAQLRLEGNIARIVSGKMTDQQRQWFLRSAKDNYDNARTVASKYETDGSADQGGGAPSKGRRSLKTAMALPFNKGKSEAEVTQDLQTHGYEVAP